MIKRFLKKALRLSSQESKIEGITLRIDRVAHNSTEVLFAYPELCENATKLNAVSSQFGELTAVKANDVLAPYRIDEAVALTRDWYRALTMGGRIEMGIPSNTIQNLCAIPSANTASLVAELLDTSASRKFRDCWSNDVVKGLLEYSGFVDVNIDLSSDGIIRFSGIKTLDDRERQVCPVLHGIRADHRARYLFAMEYLPENGIVLDVACGIGYGAKILSSRVSQVVAVDLDEPAIGYAERYYSDGRISYKCEDALTLAYDEQTFDGVCSFETIEHVPDPARFIQSLFGYIKKGGVLVCSTPNQDTMPFSRTGFPFHFRHFQRCELEALLMNAGFEEPKFYSQHDRETEEVVADSKGLFHLAVARKPLV